MVLDFFDQDQGGLGYLLKNPTAKLLKGNPDVSVLLIASLPEGSGQRYTAGVISEVAKVDDQTMRAATP